ncbi:MAG: aldo/keto reductase [Proteobacteria bacterium]|nr:aldo/keto reductase [Pseudomonadota bacterium]
MKQRRIGRSGLVVSEICLGTMTFGSMADEKESLAICDRALDAGINFLDVAEIYPVPPRAEWAGRSEEIVGKWLQDRPRDSLVIATKVAGPGLGWFQNPVRSGITALDRHHIQRAVDDSLRRLGTDYIDLYQTHWPDPEFPIEATLEALDRLVEEGKVRYAGCSNQSAYGLTKSLWMSDRNGTLRYESIQNNYSLMQRGFDAALAEVCRQEQVSLLPYSPNGGGVLTGKYQDGAWPAKARFTQYREDAARGRVMTGRFVNEKTLATTERVLGLARDAGLAPATLATAWTLSRDFVASTIIGATAVGQLDDTLAAADVTLSDDVLAACDAIARDIPNPMD